MALMKHHKKVSAGGAAAKKQGMVKKGIKKTISKAGKDKMVKSAAAVSSGAHKKHMAVKKPSRSIASARKAPMKAAKTPMKSKVSAKSLVAKRPMAAKKPVSPKKSAMPMKKSKSMKAACKGKMRKN